MQIQILKLQYALYYSKHAKMHSSPVDILKLVHIY